MKLSDQFHGFFLHCLFSENMILSDQFHGYFLHFLFSENMIFMEDDIH